MKAREIKKKEADERLEKYSKLSLHEKIKKLDEKYGVGLGAIRQRERLNKMEIE